jgi:hypothetical protein
MKLLFSEGPPDYANYIFPYVIWAFPEKDEDLSRIFEAGFLPSSRLMQRFYMARQIRVALASFKPSSENRRVLRKCAEIKLELLPRDRFDYTEKRRSAFKDYADAKFGPGVMGYERLDELFRSPIVTHVLQYTFPSGEDAGSVALFLHESRLAFYYYAFYDLNHCEKNLGMYLMTSAVKLFSEHNYQHIYLGTCYSEKALYKTQFPGTEFFNGVSWSRDLDQLKFVLRRDTVKKHLLEDPDYIDRFHLGNSAELAEKFGIRR